MIENKHISKLIAVLMAAAVAFCFLAMVFSEHVEAVWSGKAVAMEYESKLFDTEKPMQIDIQMERSDWDEMLQNAITEEYYTCDVVIDGQKFYSVAIRPKGNTSLSSIAMDETTDRFSLKLEFDHFVEGQTCYGLDKLVLNNNFMDATNMKEAVIYDMYQYLNVDASLYNYAEISLNGEYWGVYLALEAVEDSFLLRNYGTENGELYKPEGTGDKGGDGGFAHGGDLQDARQMPQAVDTSQEGGQMPQGADASQEGGQMPQGADATQEGGQMPQAADATQEGEQMAQGADASQEVGQMPQGADTSQEGGQMAQGADASQEGGQMVQGADASQEGGQMPPEITPEDASAGNHGMQGDRMFGASRPEGKGAMPGRGFSMDGNGADLNYTDDDLDSYSTIWDGEVTKTNQADHKRVVTALKHISQGSDLETYLDIDNILKYMAVHTFSVNLDSLSGNMAHNYYLYEYDGRLNILPWDYNLSFGGMSAGAASGGSDMVNAAIDTPFQGTQFFDALLENEVYLEQYHGYLQQLVQEYVSGGKFDETYKRIRSQIDELVKTDPTAFYSYDAYTAGADMLYQTVLLRAESISGQLQGEIPSTDEGQREDASQLVDASEIDIAVMGVFRGGGGDGRHAKEFADAGQEASEEEQTQESQNVSDESGGVSSESKEKERTQEAFSDNVLEIPSDNEGSMDERQTDVSDSSGQPAPNVSETIGEGQTDIMGNASQAAPNISENDDKGQTDISDSSGEDLPSETNAAEKIPSDSPADIGEAPPVNPKGVGEMQFGGSDNTEAGLSGRAKQNAITYAVCFLVLCVGLILTKAYVRKAGRKR